MKTKTMPAGIFKTKCLQVMDEVQARCEPVIITKRGKPVVKLVPVNGKQDEIFGFLRGKVKILGDIVSPAIPLKDWERLK
jgi:prevent-host-death family protein